MKRYHRTVQRQFLCFGEAKVAGYLVVVRVVVTGREGIFVWSERERERNTHTHTHRGARILVWGRGAFVSEKEILFLSCGRNRRLQGFELFVLLLWSGMRA